MLEGNAVVSSMTAMTRSGPSAPLKKLIDLIPNDSFVLDYGCGKGADVRHLSAKGYSVDGYDPHWSNIDLSDKNNYYDVILCTYVLNVLPKDAEGQIVDDIVSKLKVGGTAYITVRRDSFSEGKTSRGFQRHVYLKNAESFYKNSSYETYIIIKE